MITSFIFVVFLILPLLYCLHKKQISNYVYYAILIYWFPVKLPFGSVLEGMNISEFFLFFATFLLLLDRMNNRDIQINRIPVIIKIGIFIFILGGLLSILNSIDDQYLWVGLRQMVLLPILIIVITAAVFKRVEDVEKAIKYFFISTLVLLFVLFIYPKSQAFIDYRGASAGRLGGEFLFFGKYDAIFYESTLGAFLGFIIPLSFSKFLNSQKKNRAINRLKFILLIAFLLLTVGRSGWIAAIIGSIIVYSRYFFNTKNFFTFVTLAFTSIIVIIVIINYVMPFLGITDLFMTRLSSFQNLAADGNIQTRLYQWGWAYQTFTQNIWGIGIWNFEKITTPVYGRIFAGNSTWLSLLLDVGIVGTIGFLLVYISSLRLSLHTSFSENFHIKQTGLGILACLTVFIISASGENSLHLYYFGFAFWLITSIATNLYYIEKHLPRQIVQPASELISEQNSEFVHDVVPAHLGRY